MGPLTYLERNKEILKRFRLLKPTAGPIEAKPERFMKIETGYKGVHFEWWHRQLGPEKGKLEVALHFESGSAERNRGASKYLEGRRVEIEASVGERVGFDHIRGKKGSSVFVRRTEEPWSAEVALWAAERMHQLMSTLDPLLKEYIAAE